MTTSLSGLHNLVWTALLAALIAIGAIINIPIGPVPFTLQTMFIALAGLILGPKNGTIAVALYLLAGGLGLPIFAGGKAGFAHFFGPTGGYLIGFLCTAALSGLGSAPLGTPPKWISCLFWSLLGVAALLTIGSLRLKFVLDVPFEKAFAIGAAPFILGGIAKTIGAVTAYRFLHSRRLVPA